MIFKGETNCEKCIHKKVCSAKNPVSYTHLDVYKRQAIYCMKSFADDTVCEECDNYDGCDHTMVADNAKTAIEALEKQMAKKPEMRTAYNDFDGRLICYKGFCPSCGGVVESYRNESCHRCV